MHLLFKMHADLTAHVLFALKTTIPYRFCEVLIGRDLLTRNTTTEIKYCCYLLLLIIVTIQKENRKKERGTQEEMTALGL